MHRIDSRVASAWRPAVVAGSWTLLSMALLPPPLAQAQPQPAASADAVTLQTVTVTARLRPETEQQVPASLAVVDGETLAAEGIHSLGALDSRVANLQFGDLNGTPTLFLRGTGGGGRQVAFEPRAGIYLDGVFMNVPPLTDALLLDLDRVEVLRGPQGSLFGQNTVSGAVRLISREPGERFSVQGLTAVDSRGAQRLAAAADLPLIDQRLLFRVSGNLARADGVVRNLADGRYPDACKEAGLRARLQWRLSPTLRADFSADTASRDDDFPTGEAFSSSDGRGPDANPTPYTVALDAPQHDDLRSQGLAASLQWQLPLATLTSISSWREAQRHWLVDLDYSAADGAQVDFVDRYQRWSQELRLSSPASDAALSWLGGFYAFRQIADSERPLEAGDDVAAFIPTLAPGDRLSALPRLDTRSYALFGSLGYRLREDLRLDAGLRLVTVQQRLDFSQQATSGFSAAGFRAFGPVEKSASETAVLPDLALSWDLRPTLSTYARYARGSKSGGFDAEALGNDRSDPPAFGEETVDSYELGLKSQLLDDRLHANLAWFLAEYRDYQVSQFRPVGSVNLPVLSNAGKLRSYGPELELLALPLRGLRLQSSAAWLHAEYVEFVDGGGAGVDYSGKRAEFAPSWMLNGAMSYDRPVPWGTIARLQMALDYSWRSRFYTQPSNREAFHADSRSLLGARLSVRDIDGRVELSLYGDNLLDDRYVETLNRGTLGTLYGRYGAPRTLGLRVQVRID